MRRSWFGAQDGPRTLLNPLASEVGCGEGGFSTFDAQSKSA